MKNTKFLQDFFEGVEMTILPIENHVLLSSVCGGDDLSGYCEVNRPCSYNNCGGGNCVKGCS